jgi:hypothetical protein
MEIADLNPALHAIALRMRVVEGFRKTASAAWAATFLRSDSSAVGDGLACFRGIADAGVAPPAMATGSGAAGVELPGPPRVNTVPGNVKTAMKGPDPRASPEQLPRALAAHRDRLNRRFDPAAMLPRLGVAAARTPPMPYRLLTAAEAPWSSGRRLFGDHHHPLERQHEHAIDFQTGLSRRVGADHGVLHGQRECLGCQGPPLSRAPDRKSHHQRQRVSGE